MLHEICLGVQPALLKNSKLLYTSFFTLSYFFCGRYALSFSRVGAKIWNAIPPRELRELEKAPFKGKLKANSCCGLSFTRKKKVTLPRL